MIIDRWFTFCQTRRVRSRSSALNGRTRPGSTCCCRLDPAPRLWFFYRDVGQLSRHVRVTRGHRSRTRSPSRNTDDSIARWHLSIARRKRLGTPKGYSPICRRRRVKTDPVIFGPVIVGVSGRAERIDSGVWSSWHAIPTTRLLIPKHVAWSRGDYTRVSCTGGLTWSTALVGWTNAFRRGVDVMYTRTRTIRYIIIIVVVSVLLFDNINTL